MRGVVRHLILAVLLSLLAPGTAHAERAIFLLAGQSNAAGTGQDPAPGYRHAARIFVYRNADEWAPGREPVDEPERQVDAVSRDTRAGVGIGMAFADRLLELRPEIDEIGLVPCAKGGSTLTRWAPHWSRQSLYGSCLARALAARGEGYVAGVLWWQGEDSPLDVRDKAGRVVAPGEASRWGYLFASMARAMRVDLGDLSLPMAYARIRAHTPATRVVRDQQEQIADGPAVMVSTDGVEYPDGWHPTTAGYQEIGRRYAEALAPVLPSPSHAGGRP